MRRKIKSAETMSVLLQRVMRERGITTISKIARDLNITCMSVSRWVQGGGLPSDGQIGRIADYFGIPSDALMRARELSWLMNNAPSFVQELRRYYSEISTLSEDEKQKVLHMTDENLPLLDPRQLPTRFQRFKIDPGIHCGLLGPILAVCDKLLPIRNDDLAVVLLTQRRIRFDRYDKKLYRGRTAYRVTAILPKE
jgi:transcriptional regulator with XRE-family HTH domain